MKKLLMVLWSICGVSSILYGCARWERDEVPDTPSPPKSQVNKEEENPEEKYKNEKIKVFYGDSNNEKMIAEEREISYMKDEEKYKAVLEELIKGPESQNLISNITRDTEVIAVNKNNTDVIADFNETFNRFEGSVAEIIAVGSVVNTLTQFEEVERAKILIEGEELLGPNGLPRGYMTAFPLQP
ncbi:MAG: Lipoprotein LpqB, GerMN domain protein [Clostridia bacterium]|nr:Lipoprotein LpqB, GerMN domain protein [Clostridia bacterium]